MREILNIALVLAVAGFFVATVMALSLALSKTVRHRDGRDEEPNPSWNDWSSCHATKRHEELSGGASATALINSRTCGAEAATMSRK